MQRWVWAVALGSSVSIAISGCGGGGDFKTAEQIQKEQPAHADDHGHDHGHGAEGPHHGAVVELGEEEFHAEIVLDEPNHTLKLYILGPDAKTAATTAADSAILIPEEEGELKLTPGPGQIEGQYSVFQLVDEKVVHKLAEEGFLHGNLKVKVGEKDYTASVDAHFHGEHDHDHEPKAATPATTPAPAETPAPSANP